MNLTCEQVASSILGPPVKRRGSELFWLCSRHDDRDPSLQINSPKNAFLCGPCGKSGNAWRLFAFLENIDPNDKRTMIARLKERGLLNGNGSNGNGRAPKPPKEEFRRVAEFYYGDTIRHVRLEAPSSNGTKPPKAFVWESRKGDKWVPGLQGQQPPLYTNRLFRESDQIGLVLAFEGEAKADLAGELGFAAVSFKGFTAAHCEVLAGLDIVFWPDKDQPGVRQAHAAAVILAESKQARSIRMITPPPDLPIDGDIVDAVKTLHYTREKILSLIEGAKPYPPEPEPVGILLDDVQEQKVDWLWPQRIPMGALTILDGDPGSGKSLLTLEIAARVSRGYPLPGETNLTEPMGVVILSAEDSVSHVIRPRLRAANADLSRVLAIPYSPTHEGQPTFSKLPTDIPILEKAVGRVKARLVIFDVLVGYIPSNLSTNRDQDVRLALAPLAEMADRTGVAVILVRHLSKDPSKSALYRGGGSIGIVGAARSGLLLATDPQQAEVRVLAVIKSNLGAPSQSLTFRIATDDGVPHIEWLGGCSHTAESLLAVPVSGEDRSAKQEAVEFLSEELQDGPLEVEKLIQKARRLGISEKTLRRAKMDAGIGRERRGFGDSGKWYWMLPRKMAISGIDGQHTEKDGHL